MENKHQLPMKEPLDSFPETPKGRDDHRFFTLNAHVPDTTDNPTWSENTSTL